MSASHNPPDDNGVKVYDDDGSQPVAPEDERLAEASWRDAAAVRTLPFERGPSGREWIRPLPRGPARRPTWIPT